MKSMHINFVLGSLFFLLLIICSCVNHKINSNNIVLSSTTNNDLKKTEKQYPLASKILESEQSGWKSTEISPENKEPISEISFINERIGWACNKKNIFKTENSGKTWRSFKIDFVGTGEIVFFQFTDDLQGWLIVEDANKDGYSKDDRIKVYNTSDSGRSWKLTHSEMSVSFRDAQFSKEDGWVTAMKFVGDNSRERSPLVLYFSNQDGWKDVSESVKNLSFDPVYREGDLPPLDCLTTEKDNCVIAVNKPGKIFQSCDKGRTWQVLYNVNNFPSTSSYGPKEIGFQNDFIWMIESAGAIDGRGTIITILSTKESGKQKTYSLPNYIKQGFAVSENEFFLAGSTDMGSGKRLINKGVILHSNDSGKTWNKLLLMPQEIKSVQFFPPQKIFWILTENGGLNRATSEGASSIKQEKKLSVK